MDKIIIDGCECVCESARIVEEVVEKTGLQKGLTLGLVLMVILLVILGLYIGWKKMKGDDDKDSGSMYY